LSENDTTRRHQRKLHRFVVTDAFGPIYVVPGRPFILSVNLRFAFWFADIVRERLAICALFLGVLTLRERSKQWRKLRQPGLD